jgi:hypothetical protein
MYFALVKDVEAGMPHAHNIIVNIKPKNSYLLSLAYDIEDMHSSDANIKTKVAMKSPWNITVKN